MRWFFPLFLLLLPLLQSPQTRAQTRAERREEARRYKELERIEKYSSHIFNDGESFLPPSSELRSHLLSELSRINRSRKGYNPVPDLDRVLQNLSQIASSAPGNKNYRFHYFKKSDRQEMDYCWSVLSSLPHFEDVLSEIREEFLRQNPQVAACTLGPSSRRWLEVTGYGAVMSYEKEEDVPVYKKKFKLFSDGEKVSRNRCNGFTTAKDVRVLDPHSESVFVKNKKGDVRRFLMPEFQKIQLDLDPVLGGIIKRTEAKLQSDLDEKVRRRSEELQKQLPKITEDPTAPTVFGNPKEKAIAMLIDFSSSVDDVRAAAIESMKMTILGLKDNQNFTIGFLTDSQSYFNNGAAVPATPENKANAIDWLDQNANFPSGGDEPFADAFSHIKRMNPLVEKIYIFTDGVFEGSEVENERRVIPTLKAPVDVRAMGDANPTTLNMIAKESGGKVIQGEFSTASLGEFEKRMAEVREYQKKAKEIIKQIQGERAKLEQDRQEELARLRNRIKRFKEHLRAKDGKCPDTFQFDV